MKLGTLAIVGVGLIGGSIGKAVKERGIAGRVVGIETNSDSAQWALENGLIDEVTAQVPDDAELVALCMPSDLVAEWVVALRQHPATLFDVGSVKGPIIEAIAASQPVPSTFVPCHPVSGSERSGPQAADAALFDGCTVVVTPLQQTSDHAQQACCEFWQALGAGVVRMQPDAHDAALAVTSHLPHLLAFAFM
ncbi:MAG: prephenate dehydrogenase/arogenate dehydrogenase family protein [Proteobacteria bacterium]|nr:prephenate dehydrogenase/arogenate dehydrogenase family protein [Pseudomonadota bacterium]